MLKSLRRRLKGGLVRETVITQWSSPCYYLGDSRMGSRGFEAGSSGRTFQKWTEGKVLRGEGEEKRELERCIT